MSDDLKWGWRFLDLAELVSTWSKDPSTKCGSVIVRPDRTVASVGYNGFPKGCDDSELFYEHRPTKYARIIHAEMNAILNAREPLEGYTMYNWPPGGTPSCDRCAVHVIQSGISTVVHKYQEDDSMNQRQESGAGQALDMYQEAGVRVIRL